MMKTSILLFNSIRGHSGMLVLAVCLLAAGITRAESVLLRDVRVGPHKKFDRTVIELNSEIRYQLSQAKSGLIDVHLYDVSVKGSFNLPELPDGMKYITGIDAYRVGDNDLTLEIHTHGHLIPIVFELKGEPWRLVIDLASEPMTPPIEAGRSRQKKPEYIPGDRPVETRMAESAPKPAQHSLTQTKVESHSDSDIELPVDPAQAVSILAFFFAMTGDTEQARLYAECYHDLADSNHELFAERAPALIQPETPEAGAQYSAQPPIFPGWITIAAALLMGLLGGVIGSRLRLNIKIPNLSLKFKPKSSKPATPASAGDLADEIEKNIDTLDSAVKAEQPASKETPVEVPAEVQEAVEASYPSEDVSADAVASESEEVKESAMDRRVKRVLELSKGGQDIQFIAKELEMSQDEVKLILDLK